MTCKICDDLRLELALSNNDRLSESLMWKAYDRLQEHMSTHNANELCSCGKSYGARNHQRCIIG